MAEQIDIMNIIRRVLKQWMIIMLTAIIIACGSGIVASRIYKPQYVAQTIIVVYDKDAGSGINSAEETVAVFKEIITSNLLQKKVAEVLGIPSLPGTISCENVPNTNMIIMKVKSDTPQDTMLVMNGVLDHYDEAVSQLLGNNVLRVLEEPQVPVAPETAFDEFDVLAKVFIAVVALMSGALLLFYYFRDDIKNEKQVETKLDVKLFASIPHENLQKGFRLKPRTEKVGLLLTNPVTSFGYIETFKKICVKLHYQTKKRRRKVLLITSVQENEGKSTVSANLALSLAKSGKNVLLVDADLRKPAQFKLFTQTYQKEDPQIGSVLSGHHELGDAVRRIDDTNVYLLAGNRSYKNATKLLLSETAMEVYGRMKEAVDYVIVDTPPLYQAADAEELMRFADAGLLVVRQNCSKTKDINDAIDVFRKTNCRLLGCIFNDVETGILGKVIPGIDNYHGKYGYGNYKKKELKDEQ